MRSWRKDYRGDNANKTLKRNIWQYSSKGKVDRISGNVDVNECYRDFAAIIKGAGLNGFAKETGSTPAPQPENSRTYTVKPGDSFWSIAEKELGDGARYKELAAYNGLKPTDTIYAGQVLKLPDKTATAAKTSRSSRVTAGGRLRPNSLATETATRSLPSTTARLRRV